METLFALLLFCSVNSTQCVSNAVLWCRSCIDRDCPWTNNQVIGGLRRGDVHLISLQCIGLGKLFLDAYTAAAEQALKFPNRLSVSVLGRLQRHYLQQLPWYQGSWGKHGAHLGPTGPRWVPCWPHEPWYLGIHTDITKAMSNNDTSKGCIIRSKCQQNIRGECVTTVLI